MIRRRRIRATVALLAGLLVPIATAPPAAAGNPCNRVHYTHYGYAVSGTYRYVLVGQRTVFSGSHYHDWRMDKYDRYRHRWVVFTYFTCSPGKWGA